MSTSQGTVYANMGQLCCFRLSLTTRIIGTFGLSTSILMINVVLSEFFSRESNEHFLLSVESWNILGTNWINLLKKAKFISEAATVLACILSFAFVSLLVNAFLILGTNVKRTSYYLPWMYLYFFTIVDQTAAITLHLSHLMFCDIYFRSPWYMRVSSVYLILYMYFWTIVYTNKNERICRTSTNLTYIDARPTIVTITSDSNVPKSPSFVSAISHSPFDFVVKSEPPPDLPPPYSSIAEKF